MNRPSATSSTAPDGNPPAAGSRSNRGRTSRIPLLFLACAVVAGQAAPSVAATVSGCAIEVRAAQVDTGDGFALDRPVDGATEVRLAGIDAPPPPRDDATGGWAETARIALDRLTRRGGLCLDPLDPPRDRYGRLVADVRLADGTRVQDELLRLGLARVRITPASRSLAAGLLLHERAARAERAGLWRTAAFRVRTPEDAEETTGSFQIVEGRVFDAARRQDRWYLNFGPDWRTDFTVVVPAAALPAWAAAGLQPYGLKDRRVRVRGWVQRLNGPMIEAPLPEQVELLD